MADVVQKRTNGFSVMQGSKDARNGQCDTSGALGTLDNLLDTAAQWLDSVIPPEQRNELMDTVKVFVFKHPKLSVSYNCT